MKTISLEETCRFFNGYAFKSKDYVSKGIRIIRIANVQKGYIEDKLPCYYPYDSKAASDYALARGDLLISLTGNVGRVGLMPDNLLPAALNQRVACLRVKDDSPLTREFIYAMLNSDQFEQKAIESSNGVAQKNLSASWLKKYQLPLITKGEQTSFCKRFSIIDSNLSKCRTTASRLDSLIKSRFVEMFGDPIENDSKLPKCKWEDVLTIVNGKNQKKVECATGEYPICGSGGEMGRARQYLTKGDSVIIGRKGNINNPILMREPFWNVDTAFGLEPNAEILIVEYLYYYCEWFDFQKLNKAVTIPSLTKADLLKIEMPLPPLALQQEFAAFVSQVDKLRFATQQQIDKLETLKKSLMQEYFG